MSLRDFIRATTKELQVINQAKLTQEMEVEQGGMSSGTAAAGGSRAESR